MANTKILKKSEISAPRANIFGVSVALVTPFTREGAVDLPHFANHANDLAARGVDGITLFGTTGEGASLGMSERLSMQDAVKDLGKPDSFYTAAIVACDLETAEGQARAAFKSGIRRLLVTPPFYFKGVEDAALFQWFNEFIRRIADADPEIILYHIPQVTGVYLNVTLIRQVKDAYPDIIFGVKDSSGNWDHVASLLPMDDLAILIGDERLLARAAPLGGAGAITGMANLFPHVLHDLIFNGQSFPALDALVDEIVKLPVTPLVKALVGVVREEEGWQTVRAPLQSSTVSDVACLGSRVIALAAKNEYQWS